MPWKKVKLSGQSGYWAQVDNDNNPTDFDEKGHIRVYDKPEGQQVALAEQVKPAYITRERDDKFAAQERARQIDEKVKNSGTWKFADAISYAPYAVALPIAAEVAPTFVPGSPFWMNPATRGMLAGTAMSNGVDTAIRLGTHYIGDITNTGTGYNTWEEGVSDLVNKATGWNPHSSWWGQFLAGATNPGWGMNPSRIMNPIGKVGNAIETGINKAMTLYNSPLTGRWTTIGGQQYRLSPAAGANRISVEKTEPFWDTNAYDLIKTTDKGQHLIREKATGKSYIAEIKFKQQAQERGLNTEAASPEQKYEQFLQKEFLPELKKLVEINANDEKIKALFKSYNMSDRLSTEDIKLLRANASYYNIPQRDSYSLIRPVLDKAAKNMKGAKGVNVKINEAVATQKAKTSEGQYDLYLNNDDAQALEEIRRQTQRDYGNQIQFNEFQGGILSSQNIPKAVAVTPIEIPGVGKLPLMERYLHNARERAEQLLPDLVRRGYMYVDPKTKMWVGSYTPKEGNFQPIDPAMFVLSFINNIRNSSNRVPVFREYSRAGTRELVLPIAWHGTPTGDANLLTQYANPTNIKSIFTTVSDGMPGSSNVKTAYQRGGTSIPFLFKRKSYNGRIYQEKSYHPLQGGGNKSTGYILEDGTPIGQLIDHFGGGKGGGTARYVYDVSDQANIPHNSAQPQTEYIFGMGTPEVKSLLNTGDYLPYFNEEGKLIEGVTPFNRRGGKITINNQILC